MQTILDMEPIENPPPKRSRGRAWRVVAIVLALHAVALGGFVVFQGCQRSEPDARAEDAAVSPAASENLSAALDAPPAWSQAGAIAQPGSSALTPEERAPDAFPPPPAPPPPLETEVAPPAEPPVEPPPAPVEAKPAGSVIHVVKSGETPASIAKKYGVTAAALMHANHIVDASKLKIGQKLVVPSAKLKASAPAPRPAGGAKGAVAKGGGKTHVVKSGETLTSIAKRYGVTVNALMKANGIVDASKLKIGQKLKLPASRAPAGGPSTSSDPRQSPRRFFV